MNLCFFFEGTGRNGEDEITNVTRLHNAMEFSGRQLLHLEPGPGTHFGSYLRGRLHGHDWWFSFRKARRWYEKFFRPEKPSADRVKVFLFGFSRGALIARHFAAWLDKLGTEVAFMGLWDTVDSTLGLDVSETAPANVRFARHAVARDEMRRMYGFVPIKAPQTGNGRVEQLLFPGSHTDVGGLFEDNHTIADHSLAWIADGAKTAGAFFTDSSVLDAPVEDETPIIHDSCGEATNLWGLLGRSPRNLEGIESHPICGRQPPSRPEQQAP
jgi:uncharacterized protein (DUF2235 family)